MNNGAISIVVPALQEEERVQPFLRSLREARPKEIILVDGGSSDATADLGREEADHVLVESGGLAEQLNAGAEHASGEVLFFPYCDTRLPSAWPRIVLDTLADSRTAAGAFRLGFDSRRLRYRIIAGLSNFRTSLRVGPFGDQAIFLRRKTFEAVGGYRADVLLEDLDLVSRVRRHGRVRVAPEPVRSSVRRWERDGALPTTLRNWKYLAAHFLGSKSRASYRRYRVEGR